MAQTFTGSDERKARGIEALNKYFAQSLAFVSEGPPTGNREPRNNGTGTLISTPHGRIIILTAKHVLEDDPPHDGFTLGGAALGAGGMPNPFVRHWSHPSVDAAVALLTKDVSEKFGGSAVSYEKVAASEDDLTDKEDAFLCGFPAEYRLFTVDHAAKTIDQQVHSIVYRTSVSGPDSTLRYRATWTEGVTEDPSGAYRALGVVDGKPFKQKHPRGISGGPLWKVGPVDTKAVWAPEVAAKIIGIACTFGGDTQFCPSVRLWGDWFRAILTEVDALDLPGIT